LSLILSKGHRALLHGLGIGIDDSRLSHFAREKSRFAPRAMTARGAAR
jgi:hypothetical protein